MKYLLVFLLVGVTIAFSPLSKTTAPFQATELYLNSKKQNTAAAEHANSKFTIPLEAISLSDLPKVGG